MPQLGLTLLVASVAFADSINPSTVVPALYLAGSPRARGLATYTVGVFLVYLAGGIVLVLGPGPALIAALHHAGPRFEHGVETVVGLLALVFAVVLWRSRGASGEPRRRRFDSPASAFALGAGISAVELPTAFLYFGAVTAILNSNAGSGAEVALVVAYNALFVLPLVAVIVFRARIRHRLAAVMAWTRRSGPLLLAGISALAGAALLAVGASGLVSA
ncbi:MAG: GAP family protein [Gaiellaceae bacterium]